MKLCGRILLIVIWILLILSFGYYAVFSNLGSLLTANYSGFSCSLISEGVRLRVGDSVEVFKLKYPLQIQARDDQWVVKTSQGTVSFSFTPRPRIQWEKSDQRRSSVKNGE